jgi:hypothetical protein
LQLKLAPIGPSQREFCSLVFVAHKLHKIEADPAMDAARMHALA